LSEQIIEVGRMKVPMGEADTGCYAYGLCSPHNGLLFHFAAQILPYHGGDVGTYVHQDEGGEVNYGMALPFSFTVENEK